MKAVLRYGKVKEIYGDTVHIIACNPQTGKHVEAVFPRVPSTIISMMKETHRQGGFVFIKEPRYRHYEYGVEGEATTRPDSYFTLFSYVDSTWFNPLYLRKLDDYLVTMESYDEPIKPVARFVLNAVDKLGQLVYATEVVTELNGKKRPSHTLVRYHVFMAIASCKGALDGLAAILNEAHSIGYTKGKVDLSRSDLVDRVADKNPELGGRLKAKKKWFDDLTRYRDAVEHRMMILTSPTTMDALGRRSQLKCKVHSQPMGIGELPPEDSFPMDAEDFCQGLKQELLETIEIVLSDLCSLIESRQYRP